MADTTFGGWSLADARAEWVDAPSNDATLQRLLNAAGVACEAYAPLQDMLAQYGPGYMDSRVTAVLMQARNVWNSERVDPVSGGMGDESFVMKPFPLDWMVKQLLRPKTVLGWVG